MEETINLNGLRIPDDFETTKEYADIVWVYMLCEPASKEVFYVGSTLNYTSRFASHLAGRTKDNHKRIAELKAQGKDIMMVMLDITDRVSPISIEAYWINRYAEKGYQLTNTKRYPLELAEYNANPRAYRSRSQGTLVRIKNGNGTMRDY